MGDIMPKKRNSIFYKISNWLDKKLNNFILMKCEFCNKSMLVTVTEYRAVGKKGCCSDFCAKKIAC